MRLIDLIDRPAEPEPWAEGETIPWNDPAFSERMLREHLSQQHDAASRRFEKIDQQVGWIHRHILGERATSILDLGCGPGLYASRLARLGHRCKGIDFSPASIQYATQQAQADALTCSYVCDDIRRADFGSGYGLVLFIFGEFNVLKPEDVRLILAKSHASLAPGGVLLLEPSTYENIQQMGLKPSTWYSSLSGLFSDQPHFVCEERFWNHTHQVATVRYFVIDAHSAEVMWYAGSYQAYTDDEYRAVLTASGFGRITIYPSLMGEKDESQRNFLVLRAEKTGG